MPMPPKQMSKMCIRDRYGDQVLSGVSAVGAFRGAEDRGLGLGGVGNGVSVRIHALDGDMVGGDGEIPAGLTDQLGGAVIGGDIIIPGIHFDDVAGLGRHQMCIRDSPYCAGRKVLAGFNDLATLAPEVACQWHTTLNGSLTPDMVTAGRCV